MQLKPAKVICKGDLGTNGKPVGSKIDFLKLKLKTDQWMGCLVSIATIKLIKRDKVCGGEGCGGWGGSWRVGLKGEGRRGNIGLEAHQVVMVTMWVHCPWKDRYLNPQIKI